VTTCTPPAALRRGGRRGEVPEGKEGEKRDSNFYPGGTSGSLRGRRKKRRRGKASAIFSATGLEQQGEGEQKNLPAAAHLAQRPVLEKRRGGGSY